MPLSETIRWGHGIRVEPPRGAQVTPWDGGDPAIPDASPQLNRKDLPEDARIPRDGSLRFTRPERIVQNAVTALRGRGLPGRNPPAPKLYSDFETYRREVLAAINANDARRGLSGIEYTRLPVGYSSWMQGGQIYLHPEIHEALSGRDVYERARGVRVLAHEWWHAVRVAAPETCPRLEEGLAELFAQEFCRQQFGVPLSGPDSYKPFLAKATRAALSLGDDNLGRGLRVLAGSRSVPDLTAWLETELGKAGLSPEEIRNLLY